MKYTAVFKRRHYFFRSVSEESKGLVAVFPCNLAPSPSPGGGGVGERRKTRVLGALGRGEGQLQHFFTFHLQPCNVSL